MAAELQFSDRVGYGWIDSLKAHAESVVSERELASAATRFLHNPPQTREALWYRRLFDECFPGAACAATVPGGKSIACSTPEALAANRASPRRPNRRAGPWRGCTEGRLDAPPSRLRRSDSRPLRLAPIPEHVDSRFLSAEDKAFRALGARNLVAPGSRADPTPPGRSGCHKAAARQQVKFAMLACFVTIRAR